MANVGVPVFHVALVAMDIFALISVVRYTCAMVEVSEDTEQQFCRLLLAFILQEPVEGAAQV